MFCQKCGQPIPEGSNFCPACGAASVVQASVTPSQPEPVVQPQQPYTQQAPYQTGAQAPQAAYQPYAAAPQQPVAPPSYAPAPPFVQAPVMPNQPNPAPSFGDCVKMFFKNYVNFSGRSRRAEYWYVVLFQMLVGVVLGIISSIITALTDGSNFGIIITYILTYGWTLACLIPNFALTFRRLHDIGKSGAYFLIGFIPIAGPIILLVWSATDSNPAPNEFGVSPKYTPGFTYEQAQSQPSQPVPPAYM